MSGVITSQTFTLEEYLTLAEPVALHTVISFDGNNGILIRSNGLTQQRIGALLTGAVVYLGEFDTLSVTAANLDAAYLSIVGQAVQDKDVGVITDVTNNVLRLVIKEISTGDWNYFEFAMAANGAIS